MIGILTSYINNLIERDQSILASAKNICQEYAATHKLFCSALAHATGQYAIDPVDGEVYAPDTPIHMRAYQLDAIGAHGFCNAGEHVKYLERTHPELIAAYPDFPWGALKGLRNITAHPSKTQHSDIGLSRSSQWDKVQRYAINLISDPTRKMPSDEDPMFNGIYSGIWQFKAMAALTNGADKWDWIQVNSTDSARLAADMAGIGSAISYYPLLLIGQYRSVLLNGLNDRFNQLSTFTVSAAFPPHERKRIASLQAFRGYLSHEAIFIGDNAQKEEALAEALVKGEKIIKEVSNCLEKPSISEFISPSSMESLREKYLAAILGKERKNAKKLELLEDALTWVSSVSKDSPTIEWSFLQAIGTMLQNLPVNKSEALLLFIKEDIGDDLRKPSTLQNHANRAPHAIRQTLRQTLRDYEERLGKGTFINGSTRNF